MAQRGKDQPAKSGITHFPLEEEQARQEKVHEKVSARKKMVSDGPLTGHRNSQRIDAPSIGQSVERFESGGGKGGKTGGSRAGLLSSQKNKKDGRK